MKNKISIINYFNMRALFMGVGISNILDMSKELFLCSIIIGTFMGSIFLYFYKYSNKKTLLNILFSSVFTIYGFLILVNMIASNYLPNMPKLMVGIPLLLLILYILSKKKKVLLKLSNILFVLNIFIYVLAIISLIKYFNIDNFYFTNTSNKNVFIGSFEYAILSIAPTLLIRNDNECILKTYLISSFTMSIWLLLTYGILGPYLSSTLRYPEYMILKNVSIVNAVENIENIVCFMWIFDVIILISSAGYNIKQNTNNKYMPYIIMIVLFGISAFLNYDYYYLNILYNNAALIIGITLLLSTFINRKTHHN